MGSSTDQMTWYQGPDLTQGVSQRAPHTNDLGKIKCLFFHLTHKVVQLTLAVYRGVARADICNNNAADYRPDFPLRPVLSPVE